KLEYSNNPYDSSSGKPNDTGKTPEDKVTVFTYKLVVNKVDGNKQALEGAGFTLYKYDSDANNYAAVGDEIKGVTTFTFTGLDAGKYKLVETTVPDGYNQADDLEFTVEATYDTDSIDPKLKDLVVKDKDGNEISGSEKVFSIILGEGKVITDVVNNSGTELPSTGGMGTYMFYIIGGIMVAVAIVLIVSKKRMEYKK
ncbi:MAG: SpaA isopeptide-forming pilin-related protein, partial [Clostridia bacterium]|nr:SpaA isopeptide-forming pilin-related protein [Clostridia bacterium]